MLQAVLLTIHIVGEEWLSWSENHRADGGMMDDRGAILNSMVFTLAGLLVVLIKGVGPSWG